MSTNFLVFEAAAEHITQWIQIHKFLAVDLDGVKTTFTALIPNDDQRARVLIYLAVSKHDFRGEGGTAVPIRVQPPTPRGGAAPQPVDTTIAGLGLWISKNKRLLPAGSSGNSLTGPRIVAAFALEICSMLSLVAAGEVPRRYSAFKIPGAVQLSPSHALPFNLAESVAVIELQLKFNLSVSTVTKKVKRSTFKAIVLSQKENSPWATMTNDQKAPFVALLRTWRENNQAILLGWMRTKMRWAPTIAWEGAAITTPLSLEALETQVDLSMASDTWAQHMMD
jgi:hypothetical protein